MQNVPQFSVLRVFIMYKNCKEYYKRYNIQSNVVSTIQVNINNEVNSTDWRQESHFLYPNSMNSFTGAKLLNLWFTYTYAINIHTQKKRYNFKRDELSTRLPLYTFSCSLMYKIQNNIFFILSRIYACTVYQVKKRSRFYVCFRKKTPMNVLRWLFDCRLLKLYYINEGEIKYMFRQEACNWNQN